MDERLITARDYRIINTNMTRDDVEVLDMKIPAEQEADVIDGKAKFWLAMSRSVDATKIFVAATSWQAQNALLEMLDEDRPALAQWCCDNERDMNEEAFWAFIDSCKPEFDTLSLHSADLQLPVLCREAEAMASILQRLALSLNAKTAFEDQLVNVRAIVARIARQDGRTARLELAA